MIAFCLQWYGWVLVGRRGHIDVGTLYGAIQLSTGQLETCDLDIIGLDAESQLRFVLSASKGLLDIQRSDVAPEYDTIQFIHETVREHLLQEGLAYLRPDM